MKNLFIGVLITFSLFLSCCDKDCNVNPDLIVDLLTPTTDIIQGEPVDWDYIVKSIKDNSGECDILSAIASIGSIAIDFFIDENDPSGDILFRNESNIGQLGGGQSQTVSNTVDVFYDEGIYLITTKADDTNVVEERNENNNLDNGEVELKASDDIFHNASEEFKQKLQNASALVVVGKHKGVNITTYKGKPIYYAK
jgi:hypothetical protein